MMVNAVSVLAETKETPYFLPHASMTNGTTSSAHTPGPWFLEPVDLIIYDGDHKGAEAVAFAEDRHNADEREANARLIAACPELLELARGFSIACDIRVSILQEEDALYCECDDKEKHENPHCDVGQQVDHWRAYKQQIDAVIAKATGQ
ncbi:MAG: hypothetical protein U1D30_06790 [Planctomycetota bacterium]